MAPIAQRRSLAYPPPLFNLLQDPPGQAASAQGAGPSELRRQQPSPHGRIGFVIVEERDAEDGPVEIGLSGERDGYSTLAGVLLERKDAREQELRGPDERTLGEVGKGQRLVWEGKLGIWLVGGEGKEVERRAYLFGWQEKRGTGHCKDALDSVLSHDFGDCFDGAYG